MEIELKIRDRVINDHDPEGFEVETDVYNRETVVKIDLNYTCILNLDNLKHMIKMIEKHERLLSDAPNTTDTSELGYDSFENEMRVKNVT